jgi:hypothetical protein
MFGSLVAMLDQWLVHVGRGQVRSQASSGSAGWWSVEVKTRRSPKRICIALTKRTCQSSTFASVDTGSLNKGFSRKLSRVRSHGRLHPYRTNALP